jgi:hypothetical protein
MTGWLQTLVVEVSGARHFWCSALEAVTRPEGEVRALAYVLTQTYIDKASCVSAGVGCRDAAVKPTRTYSWRPGETHQALLMYTLVIRSPTVKAATPANRHVFAAAIAVDQRGASVHDHRHDSD